MKKLAADNGAMTLEASIIFPVVFYCTLAMLFFAVLIFQSVLASHAATLASERGAAFWDNSYKDGKNGSFQAGRHDGLYWRLFNDKLIDRLFSDLSDTTSYAVTLPPQHDSRGLPERKLERAALLLPNIFQGELKYDNSVAERTVTTSLTRPLYQAAFHRLTGSRVSSEGQAVAAVVEPVEFIRSVELARYMHTKLQMWSKQGISAGQAAEAVKQAAAQSDDAKNSPH
ncbi:TadE family protein [Paenibacillus apiarius]|uniref:Pilus assembly protein n=1 Tax=Paenibacillus apiarius TaxID=46240 RepID=A0ABT4DYI4_9BACL|nr:TadE family protein [Paenibacillus apiarius]MCY9514436.1 pilus assembly protein [Paenibacillus apiarius]MCY9521026.1 pilus assembly protein [Paenibacillus apiarius]MCY9551872.1 pilus assembly protein [Paenibacillus apiarius]MCY9557760.1 pilus assembly protein [Paenibacillus apiarius]MCY9684447.1 pilus assembly protein [Paenibacillus apiarius]